MSARYSSDRLFFFFFTHCVFHTSFCFLAQVRLHSSQWNALSFITTSVALLSCYVVVVLFFFCFSFFLQPCQLVVISLGSDDNEIKWLQCLCSFEKQMRTYPDFYNSSWNGSFDLAFELPSLSCVVFFSHHTISIFNFCPNVLILSCSVLLFLPSFSP